MRSGNPLTAPRPLSRHPVDVGLRTEAAIASALVRLGHRVLLPHGVNQRYDMVVDLDGEFLRIQCKTGRLRNGVVHFNTQSVRSNMTKVLTRGYDGEIDLFCVYCPDNGAVYAIPIEELATSAGCLRVEPTSNGQSKRVRWASEFELPA